MNKETIDAKERQIIEFDTERTLFVDAGAGAGKTHLLVHRIGSLVLKQGVPIDNIAAITFTDAAASELKERVFAHFEKQIEDTEKSGDPKDLQIRKRALQAVESVDSATITTLHSFAQRILSEFGLEIGLPPTISIVDKARSSVERDRRWRRFVEALYRNEEYGYILSLAQVLDIRIDSRSNKGASLRKIVDALYQNWERLTAWEHLEDTAAYSDTILRRQIDEKLKEFITQVEPLKADIESCNDLSDSLYKRITGYLEAAEQISKASNAHQKLGVIAALGHKGNGAKTKWDIDIATVRTQSELVTDLSNELVATVTEAVLRRLALPAAREAVAAAEQRRSEGSLEFHDLLVFCRDLLLKSASARATLHGRYRHILLDEFQDTDPLQIEIASLIATSADDVSDTKWYELPIPEGGLFFVGDPKQSIYRFRRADIELYLRAQKTFEQGSQTLLQNFRTVQPILTWANEVFSHNFKSKSGQAPYSPLQAHRELPVDNDPYPQRDHRPVVFGGGITGGKVDAIKEKEAEDIAKIITDIRQRPHLWPVFDKELKRWRDPQPSDITILVPAREILKYLKPALEQADIKYYLTTGHLIFDSQEVRDINAVITAIDNPSDEVALVAALRSVFYGCSDVDLFHWRQAGNRWSISKKLPDEISAETERVHRAFKHLRELWQQRWFITPSQLIERLLSERHAYLGAFAHSNPTEVWGRYQFIAQQARNFEDSGGSALREFTVWIQELADQQQYEDEPGQTSADRSSINIGTMHGSKGLEFPITILAGMTAKLERQSGRYVYFDENNHLEMKQKKSLVTKGFNERDTDECYSLQLERARLLYVAATRARDHLIVSLYHKAAKKFNADSSLATTIIASLNETDTEISRRLDFLEPSEQGQTPQGDSEQTSTDLVSPEPETKNAETQRIAHRDDSDKNEISSRQMWVEQRQNLVAFSEQSRFKSATEIARSIAATNETQSTHENSELVEPDAVTSGDTEEHANQFASKPSRKGRKGAAIGTATHDTLEEIDFSEFTAPLSEEHSLAITEIVKRHCHEQSITGTEKLVDSFVKSALQSEVVELARNNRHFKEVFVAQQITPKASVEGYIDLLIETPEGLVIVDYKTDAATSAKQIDDALERYIPQGATYAVALEELTGKAVTDCYFLFVNKNGTTQRRVDNLDEAKRQVRNVLN